MKAAEYRITVARSMREAELEEAIRRRCVARNFLYGHTRNSKNSPAGFPDDVIVGPFGWLVRENKRVGEKPTAKQQEWLDLWGSHGVNVGLWTPEDLLSGRIDDELAACARGQRATNAREGNP